CSSCCIIITVPLIRCCFFFQAEDGIRDPLVTGVQTCALPICNFRQQRVLWAMVKKGLALNMLDRVPTLWGQLHESVMTDMSLFDLVGMIPAAYSVDLKNHPERLHAQV